MYFPALLTRTALITADQKELLQKLPHHLPDDDDDDNEDEAADRKQVTDASPTIQSADVMKRESCESGGLGILAGRK